MDWSEDGFRVRRESRVLVVGRQSMGREPGCRPDHAEAARPGQLKEAAGRHASGVFKPSVRLSAASKKRVQRLDDLRAIRRWHHWMAASCRRQAAFFDNRIRLIEERKRRLSISGSRGRAATRRDSTRSAFGRGGGVVHYHAGPRTPLPGSRLEIPGADRRGSQAGDRLRHGRSRFCRALVNATPDGEAEDNGKRGHRHGEIELSSKVEQASPYRHGNDRQARRCNQRPSGVSHVVQTSGIQDDTGVQQHQYHPGVP